MERNDTHVPAKEATLQDCLTCYLCGDIFRRPRVLPCGHTFCSECLARIKDEIIGKGHQQRSEAHVDAHDFTENSYRQWLRPSDHVPHKQHQYSSSCGSSRHSDDSNNVDFLDADPNCYRPQPRIKSHLRRSDAGEAYQSTSDGIARSNTFIRERPKSASESSSYCFAVSSENITNSKACTSCGHVFPSILHQKIKPPQGQSILDKSLKARDSTMSKPRWDNSPQRSTTGCILEHGREMEHFVCPLPECNYSVRVMNLSRWSPRNKTVADVVSVWARQQENKQEASTQTEISNNQSLLVTIPRSLVQSQSLQTLGHRRRHSSMVDMAIHSAISMDSLDSSYIPRRHLNWRSYAAMVGMNILHQIVNL